MISCSKSVFELLNVSAEFLSNEGIENPKLDAEQLLRHTLGVDRAALYLSRDRALSESELSKFKDYLKRRAAKEPLQYILGETEFMSLPFVVDDGVLIPRPETEILVEKTLQKCTQKFASKDRIAILEFGSGSGCIAVSLAHYLENAWVTSLDVSEEAVKIAEKNARLNAVEERTRFLNLDFNSPQIPNRFPEKFDVLVSNPPYVSAADFETLPEEIKNYEPAVALHDNADGFSFFRKIAELSQSLVWATGFVALEVGLDQAQHVKELFLKRQFSRVNTFQDLNGIDRVVVCDP